MSSAVITGASSRAELVQLAAAGHALPSPVEAYFEVANRCNSKCATCPLTFSPQEQARHRRISPDQLHALAGAVGRQHSGLRRDDPRIKPSLPKLRCLQDPDSGEGGAP